MKVLVTGGCGYIGSHVSRQLSEQHHDVTVVDNLSTGFESALINGERLIKLDLSNRESLHTLMTHEKFDVVFHFAASIIVPESVENPLKYYRNNTANALNLIEGAVASEVKYFIFSSTAAVFGETTEATVKETSSTFPNSPYGTSKLMDEWILRDVAAATNLKYCALRYFNVAGADLEGRMGQRTKNATHLIKLVNECALGTRESVTIFGDDYATQDGTGVRDYIHVEDLASAHIHALKFLSDGGDSQVFNCGYGKGFSVLEVIKAVETVTGKSINTIKGPRRPGDIASVIADSSKLRSMTGWSPKFEDLQLIVDSALKWEKKLQSS